MNFFVKTKKGFAVNVAKIQALEKSISKDVITRAVGDRPYLPTVKHGTHKVFFPLGTFQKKEATLLEKDFQDLAKAAKFRGLKAKMHKVKQAIKFALS